MLAGRARDRGRTWSRRTSAVIVALVAFQAVAAGTSPASQEFHVEPLAPVTFEFALTRPLRPATPGNAAAALGHGWAQPVAKATARYAYQVRTRYYELPTPPAPSEPALPKVIGLYKAGIADVVALPPPPPVVTQLPGLALVDRPTSPYRFELDESRRVVTVTVDGVPDVAFEVDYEDGSGDLHRIGVTPVLAGHRLEGSVARARGDLITPLITPTYDAGRVTNTTISNVGSTLLVRFDGGPYTNLSSRHAVDGTTFLEVRIALTDRKIVVDLSGLYYVRPAVGTEMRFASDVHPTPLSVAADVPSFLLYLENPTRVNVSDPTYGRYRLVTDVSRLQVQWDGVGTAFELDFDHAFKDRGQTNVQSRLVFKTPVGAG